MTQKLLEPLAEFVAGCDWTVMPEKERFWARLALADFVAVAFPGARLSGPQNVLKFVRMQKTSDESVFIGTSCRADAVKAALFNGTASHAIDFDDVSWATIGHPTVSVAPAALACAQEMKADGRSMLTAYVAGVEVMHQIARWTMPFLSEKGWHTTSAYGTFVAAAAACFLYGASADQTVNALAIAASRSGGVRGNFGTQTKALHAGLSAAAGVEAAKLAMCGITGAPDVIEKADGFAQCFARPVESVKVDIGEYWDLAENGLVFKQYPCCSGSHPANDVWNEFVEKTAVRPEDIVRIRAGVSLLGPRELTCHRPQDAISAKFSLEYALAARVVHGPLDITSFADDLVCDERVQSLMQRIEIKVDPELAKLGFIGTAPVRLTVELAGGRTVHLASDLAEGNPEKPFSEETRRRKFESCLKAAGLDRLVDSYWTALLSPETVTSEFIASLGFI